MIKIKTPKTSESRSVNFCETVPLRSLPESIEEDAAGDKDEDGQDQREQAGHHQQVSH